MELSDMEKLWKENDQKLDRIIKLNEKIFSKLNVDAVSELDKMVKIYVMGRNAAFIYFVISVFLSYAVITRLAYSIPGIAGGLFMLWSFFYHLKPTEKLRQLDYSRVPVIELQKIISEFRIRSISGGKYDFAVVTVWFYTIIPLYLLVVYKIDLYAEAKTAGWYFLVAIVLTIAGFSLNDWTHRRIFRKLEIAESFLGEIIAFEKNKPETNEAAR